ncbi:carboxypeptidase S [Aureobasidium pullulans]|nr:carboxypeptidase S [Aureobasidium pullulans]
MKHGKHGKHHHQKSQCPQVEPLVPSQQTDELVNMDAYLKSPAFQNSSIQRLSGAVQIDTQSFDDLGKVGDDKRWEVFYPFHEYLEKTFPLVYEHLKVEKVNTHGLVYTWQGSDAKLKPTLLMAHQDTVPVPDATLDAWTHPPWSGFFDGKEIWGRGSSDCKNQLIAILESVELLLDAGFVPTRTVLLSFGFDEEISGGQGAGTLAPFILERYGPDSLAVIVDEGAGISDEWGVTMATPGVAEKGYTDVVITIRMPGGHSSIPPDHTAIGVMSELITLIEADKYPLRLDGKNPYLGQLYCGAEHATEFPKKLGKLLDKAQGQCKAKPDSLAAEAAKAGPAIQYLMQTSIAVDVIGGGVKVNALPERVQAIVNHRINVGEHPADAHAKIAGLAKEVAKKYGLALHSLLASYNTPPPIVHPLSPPPTTPLHTPPTRTPHTSHTHNIGSKARGGAAGPRETVIKGKSALNAAQRSGGIVATEKKFATANAASKGIEGQHLTKVDRSEDIVATKKVPDDVAKALQQARQQLKNPKGATMTQKDLASKASVDVAYVAALERPGADWPGMDFVQKIQKAANVRLTGANVGAPMFGPKKK